MCDGNGHGTHVSGTIRSQIAGYSLSTTLHAVKVLSAGGSGYTSGIFEGMDWAADTHTSNYAGTPGMLSMSLGGGYSAIYDQVVDSVKDAGLMVIVAAGNSNDDACYSSPAAADGAFTVGATNIEDTRASFSNYGICVDIFAPGRNILSTYIGNEFKYLSGTSMATPVVTGVT